MVDWRRQNGAICSGIPCLLLALLVTVSRTSGAPVLQDTISVINRTARQDLLRDLARVLGVVRIPSHLRHRSPPLFFRRLFDSMTEQDGGADGPVPYNSDTIVGYPDRASTEKYFFHYDVSHLETDSLLKNAELHLFRMKRRTQTKRRRSRRSVTSQLVEMKLYRVTHPTRRHTHFGNVLLDAKVVSKTQHGWLVFRAAEAVRGWVTQRGRNNYGFLVISRYLPSGTPVEDGTVVFAQRGHHHDRLQPSLAVYTGSISRLRDRYTQPPPEATKLSMAFARHDPRVYDDIYRNKYSLRKRRRRPTRNSRRRRRRSRRTKRAAVTQNASAAGRYDRRQHRRGFKACRRYSMYVDFRSVGWDEWIISPRGFNAYRCQGECPFPLGQQFKPSNHAVVQSIVNALDASTSYSGGGERAVHKPCCVPHRLASINMLYYDDMERVVLKQYDGMRALTCACR